MKKIYLLFFLTSTYLNSQVTELIPVNTSEYCSYSLEKPLTRNERSQTRLSNNPNRYVFNVFIHFINNVIPPEEQEIKALDMVATLNMRFNNHSIFFNYNGYENIADASYNQLSSGNINQLSNTYSTSNNIDIFVCESFDNPNTLGSTWTWHYVNSGEIAKKLIAIRATSLPETLNDHLPNNNELSLQTLNHEMGHYFGLYHTHQRWKYDSNNHLIPVSDGYSGCDAIEEPLDNSQWSTLGDLIQDTSPDRILSRYNLVYNTSNCSVIWDNYQDDNCNNHIDSTNFHPPLDNIMSYYHYCRNDFSSGQENYMLAYIYNHINGGFLTNELTDFSSLYVPYYSYIEADMDNNHIVSTEEDKNHPGYLYICRPANLVHKSQKGFTYTFYKVENGNYYEGDTVNPLDARQIAEYLPYTSEIPTNLNGLLAVKISEVSDNIIMFDATAGYRGVICRWEPVSGTVIFSTLSPGDPNGQTRVFNAQESANPHLYDSLEVDKYHYIRKQTNTGVNYRKVIYKNN